MTQVVIGSPDLKANHSITQIVEVMDEADKYKRAIKVGCGRMMMMIEAA
jgi:hypothetical protein